MLRHLGITSRPRPLAFWTLHNRLTFEPVKITIILWKTSLNIFNYGKLEITRIRS